MINNALDRRERVHFLHIGKNAGTQIKHIADRFNAVHPRYRVVTQSHDVQLRALPEEAPYFFSIRSPLSRFRSAFYCRKRKGAPRFYTEWTPFEVKAMARFEHATELAEALFEDGEAGYHAMAAIKSIANCARDQIDYFTRCGYFFEVRPPLGIIRQEHFQEDMQQLMQRLEFDGSLDPATDDRAAHRNDYAEALPLSEKAKRNLEAWYRQDFEFYRRCEAWIAAGR